MKSLVRFSFVALCVGLLVSEGWATTYYSQGSVDATVLTNWNSIAGGGGSSPTDFVSGDNFVIQNGHTMTTGSSWEVSNLTISSGGGLTMTQDVTVDNAFDLGAYLLNTGSHILIIGDYSGTGSLSRTTGFVEGNLEYKPGNGTATLTFAIGTASGYSPIVVTIPSISSPGYLKVSVTEGIEPHASQVDSVLKRYWTLLSPGGILSFTGTVTMKMSYLPGDFPGGNFTESSAIENSLTVGGYNTVSGWNIPNSGSYVRTPGGTSDGGTIEVSGLNSDYLNANITIGKTEAALPVEMVSFAATANRLSAELNWSTATEVNNFGFDIERSSLNSTWTKIGFVAGAGTSSSLHNYSYVDNDVQAGLYEYRIKQIDRDGSFKYSKTMQVEVGMAPKVLSLGSNYPNPFNPSTTIEFSVPTDGKATLKVYNVLGQEVATLFDGVAVAGNLNKATFDASRLSSGVYFSRLESGGHALVKRMMLVK